VTAAITAVAPAAEKQVAHRRLGGLLLVAVASGLVAGIVGSATASGGPAPLAVAEPGPAASPVEPCPLPAQYRAGFERAARETGLPLSMLVAVGQVESNLRADAESAAGARGLLQLMPSTAAALELNVDDPDSNVLAGALYLRQMLDRFGSTDLALAAYNAGPTAVQQAGGAPSPQVQTYVANVTAHWRSLAGCR
jgi:soluble lytic murein transglycosylase-like protein